MFVKDLSYKNSSGDVQQMMKPAEVKSSTPPRVIGHLVEVSTFGEPPALAKTPYLGAADLKIDTRLLPVVKRLRK